ncbi:uroporphyrinogen-III C-methyltransferase [Enterococcus sp. AZ109]|uniref:uroporphyrinogen-III C-methyltransferase n=1 Tax=Enterococcus sp. AZ109 TaxID=2774634 RepID=UPI003F283F5C
MISFVGAGPGDMELLTVKGQRRLQEADAVIYDRLVNPLLLFHCQKDCQLIYVGKTPYQPTMKQEAINQLLVETHQKYHRIVRLKGGDPVIFGRLTEELAAITAAGIDFEIVPGITSASATAAYNGISLTERGTARSVTFMTGHLKNNDPQAFPVLEQEQTICLYMGMEDLAQFVAHLLQQGFDPKTKAAVISWGTYGRQQKVTSTLAELAVQVKVAGIKNPAIVLIGAAVLGQEQFSWFDQLPNFGKRQLLVATRPPNIEELVSYTSQGADIWWHQVGEERDQRFDEISERYLSEQSFCQILFMDEQAKDVYKRNDCPFG